MPNYSNIYINLKCFQNNMVTIIFIQRHENKANIKIIHQHNLFVFTLSHRLFWSPACFTMEWRLSDTVPAVTAMCWGSLSFPAPTIIMTILVLAPLFVLLLWGVRHGPCLLCYQQECTNTNTFAWVIDLYLPTFLTAFFSYWQYKHMGRRITFHLQSTLALFLSLSLSHAHSLSQFVSLCSCNLFK